MPQSGIIGLVAQGAGSTTAKPLTVDANGAMQNVGVASAANGNVGVAANQTGATLSAALAPTYTGLCLSNPAGSGKNLIIARVSGLFDVAPAAFTALGLIIGFSAAGVVTHTTALTPLNALVGGGAALIGKADAACTIVGTPAWGRWMSVTVSATGEANFDEIVNGEIVIPPGGYIAIGASIAGPATGFFGSITWSEK